MQTFKMISKQANLEESMEVKIKDSESDSQKVALSLCEPQFPHLSSGDNNSNYLRGLREGLMRQCP